MKKELRQSVYDRYGGRCAYCGKDIAYKDMQIDHITPKYLGGSDGFENLNPACRACNFRKGTLSVEQFRSEIRRQCERMLATFQGRMSVAYGLIAVNCIDVKFYFEK